MMVLNDASYIMIHTFQRALFIPHNIPKLAITIILVSTLQIIQEASN